MELEKEALAAFDANFEAMEDEFEQEAREQDDLPYKEDVRNLEVFWKKRELDELTALDHQINEAMNFIHKNQYEIENHYTPFDWLKIYQESIQKHKVDMNKILRGEV